MLSVNQYLHATGLIALYYCSSIIARKDQAFHIVKKNILLELVKRIEIYKVIVLWHKKKHAFSKHIQECWWFLDIKVEMLLLHSHSNLCLSCTSISFPIYIFIFIHFNMEAIKFEQVKILVERWFSSIDALCPHIYY